MKVHAVMPMSRRTGCGTIVKDHCQRGDTITTVNERGNPIKVSTIWYGKPLPGEDPVDCGRCIAAMN